MPNHHTLQGTGKAKMFNHTSTMPEMGGTVEEDAVAGSPLINLMWLFLKICLSLMQLLKFP